MKRFAGPAMLLLLFGCHADPFTTSAPTVGPHSTGTDVQLTVNPGQDYWPAWAQDGRGILYAFTVAGSTVRHRCLGLLPAAGGTLLWQTCDNRATQGDSINSFTAYALASNGQLLFTTAVSDSNISGSTPARYTLWAADTATPFQRTALLTFPVILNGVTYSWLSDIAWTGPASFVALAQDFSVSAEPPRCPFTQDSIFSGAGSVVTGTITAGHATLQPVVGTAGATGFSLAENGASIIFTTLTDTLHSPQLFKVPATGGGATAIAAIGAPATQMLGVSCKGSTCIAANDPITPIGVSPGLCSVSKAGIRGIYSINLATGAVQLLKNAADIAVLPQLSPVTSDIVVQIGGSFGHLQTIHAPTDGNLHLLSGLVP